VSKTGVVPAVRSLDCLSIFALTCSDGETVLRVTAGFDETDPFSRRAEAPKSIELRSVRVGIPVEGQLEFFGNNDAASNYYRSIDRLQELGCHLVSIDLQPFTEAAALLYEGAWVAERTAAVGDFLRDYPDAVDPIVREIISSGSQYSATTAYRDLYRLMELKRRATKEWQVMDVLALPTTGTIYTVAEIAAEPLLLNRNLGRYTNFVNLLDLTAISLPSGFQTNGLPTGITLMARAWQDFFLCRLGALVHEHLGGKLGATDVLLSAPTSIAIAVVGAHLTGQPLNYQLIEEGGKLIRTCRTAPLYRLYALMGKIAKPGLIRQGQGGSSIEVEVWALPAAGFGRFVAAIPSPLGIGTLILEDGTEVKGFLCEPHALGDAPDISDYGGWRAYLAKDQV
jgi:allophanate hydrolase